MLIPINMAILPDGVYITELWWDGKGHPAMTNIGDNPTFENQYRRIETHVLDWDADLYGKEVSLRFPQAPPRRRNLRHCRRPRRPDEKDEAAARQFFQR